MPVNFVNIPDVLKQSASFCVWKYEKRSGRRTKVPYDPKTRNMARTNDPSTFTDFNTAMKAYAIGGWDGIGYRVSEGIGAIDIDHCIREDGSLNDVAASILGILPSAYFERSPSGTGLRGFFKLSPDFAYDKTEYYINNRQYGLEVYLPGVTNRFVTVTGDMFRLGSVERDDDALRELLDMFMLRPARVSGGTVEPCSYLDDEAVIRSSGMTARCFRPTRSSTIMMPLYLMSSLKSGRKDLFTGAESSHESILLENDHEAIIDRDTWEKVQKRLDSKGMLGRKNIQRGGGRMHFLHDKLICGCCGEFMTRRTLRAYSKPGTEPVRFKAWECYGKHKGKKGNGCKMRTVKEDVLFRAIEETIGKAVDEQSAEGIKRVVVTEDDIVVEKA